MSRRGAGVTLFVAGAFLEAAQWHTQARLRDPNEDAYAWVLMLLGVAYLIWAEWSDRRSKQQT